MSKIPFEYRIDGGAWQWAECDGITVGQCNVEIRYFGKPLARLPDAEPVAPLIPTEQPEGCKLVPLVPTEDMIVAFAEVWYSKVRCIDDCEMEDCYTAMLEAAPPAVTAKPDLAAPVEQASAEPTDSLVAENARLREANRVLHRRAQQIEAPAQSYRQRLEHIGHVSGQAWVREFDRLIRAHTEIKRIFQELARVYPYPMNAQMFHSVMDSDCENPKETMTEGAVYANCLLSTHGGIKSYRVLDEVRRAVDELLALRPATASIPPQQAPDPIYLIRLKAGGTTWTECISKQSHDAAMRLGVYESRVVVEVGAVDGSVRDAEMLDWLERNCTGASDSERYLPFRIYWGSKGATKGLRHVLAKAIAQEKAS